MGSLFSRQRDAANELKQIVVELERLNSRSGKLETHRYNALWWLTVLVLFISSTYSGVIWMNDDQPIPLVILIWSIGVGILFVIRFALVYMFSFIIRRNAKSIQDLNTRRSEIIEHVKDNEKFKVAKEIIEKFGSPQDLADIGVGDKTKSKNG